MIERRERERRGGEGGSEQRKGEREGREGGMKEGETHNILERERGSE